MCMYMIRVFTYVYTHLVQLPACARKCKCACVPHCSIRAVVGAPNKMNGNAMTTGGAYILDMSGDEFFQITDIVPSDAANAPGSFGASVGISLDGSFLVVGDPSKTGPAPNFYTEQGKAYQFYNGSLPTPTQTMSQTQTSSQTMTASSSNSASVSATPTATPSHTPTPPTPPPPASASPRRHLQPYDGTAD